MNFDFQKIKYTCDFLRIYENQENVFNVPFRSNLRWMKSLVGDLISDALNISEREVFYGDEKGGKSLRWRIYNELGLPFSINSWSSIYESINVSSELKEEIKNEFDRTLLICYETSPSLLKLYNELNIPYIDISIHPIRFLEDYVFAIRTNLESLKKSLINYGISKDLINDTIHIYKAKAAKLDTFQKIPDCSVFFAGQMGQDSSLIENGRMIDLDDVCFNLDVLSKKYPKLYYKKHPHNKSFEKISNFISKNKRIELVDWNIYDVLASGRLEKIISISSGVLHEAKYFGCETLRISTARDYFDFENHSDDLTYFPVMRLPMISAFWRAIVNGEEYEDLYKTDPYARGMQKSLNINWGGRI